MEFKKYYDLVTPESAGIRDDLKAIYVAEGEHSEARLRRDTELLSRDPLEGGELENVGNDVHMGDHDRLLPRELELVIHVAIVGVTAENGGSARSSLTGKPEVPLE